MTLAFLKPGSRFRVSESPDLVGRLIEATESRAKVQWDKPPEYVHYTTATGKTVEFYRQSKPDYVTSGLDVVPIR